MQRLACLLFPLLFILKFLFFLFFPLEDSFTLLCLVSTAPPLRMPTRQYQLLHQHRHETRAQTVPRPPHSITLIYAASQPDCSMACFLDGTTMLRKNHD
jgi:hypothetical protein